MSNEGYKWNHQPKVGIPCALRYIGQRFKGNMEVSKGGFWYYKVDNSNNINVICKKVRRPHITGRLNDKGEPEMFGQWFYKAMQRGVTLAQNLTLDEMDKFLKENVHD